MGGAVRADRLVRGHHGRNRRLREAPEPELTEQGWRLWPAGNLCDAFSISPFLKPLIVYRRWRGGTRTDRQEISSRRFAPSIAVKMSFRSELEAEHSRHNARRPRIVGNSEGRLDLCVRTVVLRLGAQAGEFRVIEDVVAFNANHESPPFRTEREAFGEVGVKVGPRR